MVTFAWERKVGGSRGEGKPAIVYVYTWNVGRVGKTKRENGIVDEDETEKENGGCVGLEGMQ